MSSFLEKRFLFFFAYLFMLHVPRMCLSTSSVYHANDLPTQVLPRFVKRQACPARKRGPLHPNASQHIPSARNAASGTSDNSRPNDNNAASPMTGQLNNGTAASMQSNNAEYSENGTSYNGTAFPNQAKEPQGAQVPENVQVKVDLLAELPTFAPKFLTRFDSVPSVFFMASFLPTLTLLHHFADFNSDSANELKSVIGENAAKASPESFKEYQKKISGMSFQSLTGLLRPAELGEADPTLVEILTRSGTDLKNTQDGLNAYVRQILPDFKVEAEEKGIVLVNVASIKLTWLYPFVRHRSRESFSPRNGKADQVTKYMGAEIFTMLYATDAYQAFTVEFANAEGQSHAQLMAYVVVPNPSTELTLTSIRDILHASFWNEVHTGLSQSGLEMYSIMMPAFGFSTNVTLSATHYPHLLRNGNTDFRMLAPKVGMKVEHRTKLCVNENGVGMAGGKVITESDNLSRDIPPERIIWVSSMFYFIIVDKHTGTPFAISKVDDVRQGRQTC